MHQPSTARVPVAITKTQCPSYVYNVTIPAIHVIMAVHACHALVHLCEC